MVRLTAIAVALRNGNVGVVRVVVPMLAVVTRVAVIVVLKAKALHRLVQQMPEATKASAAITAKALILPRIAMANARLRVVIVAQAAASIVAVVAVKVAATKATRPQQRVRIVGSVA